MLALADCGVAGCGWLRVAGGVGSGGLLLALAGCGVVLALAGQPPRWCVCTPRCQPLCDAKRDNLVDQNLKRFAVRITRTALRSSSPGPSGRLLKMLDLLIFFNFGSFSKFLFNFVWTNCYKILGGGGVPRKANNPAYSVNFAVLSRGKN